MKLGLKVTGDPKEVAKKLKTNRPMKSGQVFYSGDEFAMRKFAADNKKLVELVGDAKMPKKEIKKEEKKEEKKESKEAVKPEKNKMFSKGKFYESKSN